jgi:hypothetical protein
LVLAALHYQNTHVNPADHSVQIHPVDLDYPEVLQIRDYLYSLMVHLALAVPEVLAAHLVHLVPEALVHHLVLADLLHYLQVLVVLVVRLLLQVLVGHLPYLQVLADPVVLAVPEDLIRYLHYLLIQ